MAAETPVQFAGFRKDCIHHSCIYDPNSEDLNLDYNYNFSANPKFANYNPDNVHLAYDSPCKDKGNPVHDSNDVGLYDIDLADLVVFASETPWLWEACWRNNYIEMYGMMMGGGAMAGQGMEQEMMESTPADFEESSYAEEEQNVYANMSEPELALFVKGIYEMIELIEIWIEEDLEDADSAVEILGHLEAMLLDIGISIVLAATALEVFISHILNQLAEKKPDLVSPEIWNWFNDREWPLQNPVVKEQFGDLLKMLGGISLKDDSIL